MKPDIDVAELEFFQAMRFTTDRREFFPAFLTRLPLENCPGSAAAARSPFEFRFHWLDLTGSKTRVFSRKGRFEGSNVTLDQVQVPATAILRALAREQRLIIELAPGTFAGAGEFLFIQLGSPAAAARLKTSIDIAHSSAWAEQNRSLLERQGRASAYRQAICPVCGATIILSGMPATPQLYCRFCDSLTTSDDESPPHHLERTLRICDQCGLFGQPRKFTILYFYFLLVVYGWWTRTMNCCPACMRRQAWKMLFGNLPFLLGVIPALVQLIRAYHGGAIAGPYHGLETANIRARRGDLRGALRQYEAILTRVPSSAGVKYNLARSWLALGDLPRAVQSFAQALEACANYAPAYRQLKTLYGHLNLTERLRELECAWSMTSAGTEEAEVLL